MCKTEFRKSESKENKSDLQKSNSTPNILMSKSELVTNDINTNNKDEIKNKNKVNTNNVSKRPSIIANVLTEIIVENENKNQTIPTVSQTTNN